MECTRCGLQTDGGYAHRNHAECVERLLVKIRDLEGGKELEDAKQRASALQQQLNDANTHRANMQLGWDRIEKVQADLKDLRERVLNAVDEAFQNTVDSINLIVKGGENVGTQKPAHRTGRGTQRGSSSSGRKVDGGASTG